MVTETVFTRHAEAAKSWDATQMLIVCTVQMSCGKKCREKQHLDNDIEVARKLREKILHNFLFQFLAVEDFKNSQG